ncbi:hypothetical protein D3C81_2148350 [compost metagenome]
MEGTQDEQLDYLEQKLRGSHIFNKEETERVLFDGDLPQEREDDKCLVWISLKGGEGKE